MNSFVTRTAQRVFARFFGPAGQNERFEGGNPAGRRLASIPSNSLAINTLIRTYGKTVLGRSRYLCTNNPYAVSAKEQWIASLAGSSFAGFPAKLPTTKRGQRTPFLKRCGARSIRSARPPPPWARW